MSGIRVTVETNIALIVIKNARNLSPSIIHDLLDAIETMGVSIRLWEETGNHKTTAKITVKESDLNRTLEAIEAFKKDNCPKIRLEFMSALMEISIVSDEEMKETGILARAYKVFSGWEKAPRLMTASSDRSVTWVMELNPVFLNELTEEFS